MKKIIITLIIILSLLGYFIYDAVSYYTVIVKFDDLEPFEKQMNVYFKGFKIGKTVKIYPNDDYTNTFLKLRLKSPNTKFPQNISAKIRKKKSGGYVDIIFPDNPSLTRLKSNDEIKGNITQDISSLLEGENIEDIVVEAESLIESANSAISNLNGIFIDVRKIISENRSNINSIILNLAKSSSNLEKLSSKVNSSLSYNHMYNSVENIYKTSDNLKNLSKNINGITSQVESTTVPLINNTLCEVNQTAKNVNEISCGVKTTLKKNMGFFRFIFGSPISKNRN